MNFVLRLIGTVVFTAASFALLLFLPAWTLDWPRAWATIAMAAIASAVTMLTAFRANEDLFQERRRGLFQKDQPREDKLVLLPFIVAFYGQIVSIPLDVFHWHLLPRPPALASAFGMGMFLAGWTLITLVFRQNTFAAPVVKHMKERNHHVIDTGVYSIVRHPMYTGVAVLLPGLALWLESTAAAILSLAPTLLLAVRIGIEERFLHRELPGYTEYTRRVRWRLVPGIW